MYIRAVQIFTFFTCSLNLQLFTTNLLLCPVQRLRLFTTVYSLQLLQLFATYILTAAATITVAAAQLFACTFQLSAAALRKLQRK
jgi:hypothetical protein